CHYPPPHLHSFPTRRSSDLRRQVLEAHGRLPRSGDRAQRAVVRDARAEELRIELEGEPRREGVGAAAGDAERPRGLRSEQVEARSEEHTSELQSPYDLVCRL